MAVQNEIIKLLLQFETAFTSQDTFSNFVNKTTTELNNLDSKIKDSSEEFNKLFNVLKLGSSGTIPLKEVFKDLSQASDVKVIVENTKILKQSIEALQQVLDKKLNITNLESSLAKIQEKFIPSKGIGAEKSADFAGKFLKTIEEQFKSFASGSMDLNTFFDNLFPKDITAKGTTAKIKTELANLKSEVEKGITDLTNLTTEKRVEVLEFISKKILADSTKLSVAASAVKGDGKQLVDAIVSMAASLQDIGFLPPKDFFPNFTQGLKEQGAVQKDVIRNVLKDLMAQFNVAGFELEKNDIAFKLLERLGFNKSTLEAQFKELSSTAQKEFEKFNSSIRQAIESPKTLNLDTYIKEFQSFMTNAFKNNALVSFGDEFQAQFKKVSTELNGFTRTATQSLGEVNNFEQGIKSLINALDSGKGAGTPASLALKELLETYLQVEKQFRFDQVLKTQEQAISEFDKKFKELTNTLKNNQPPEYSLKLVTKASAGDEAFKEREVALATYNTLLKQTTEELDRTARSIAHLENIQKSTTATEDQKTSLNNLIDRYKTYQQSLSDEANILRKNQADWDATWLRKTQDLSLAEERVKNFFKVLNQSSDAGTITGTTSYLKGLLDIGVKSTESAQALESAFKIFSNFGGVTKESLQYLELFEKAIGSLFKSMGQGEGKVTLIDLSGLKAQADGTVVATETLRNQLIKLAGSSKEAQENFQNLAFANDFLAKTQGAADTAFGKQISALFTLAQAAKLYVNNIETLILKNELYEQNLRKVQAAELEVKESFKKVQDSPQDPSAVNALTQAYQKYTREIAAAELRLKELKNLQTELATQKNTFGFTEAGQQLPGLEAGIRSTTALIEQLKNKILDLRTSGGGSKIFEDIIRGVEQGNQQLKSSFDALEKDLSGRLLAITEKLNTNLSKGNIGKGLFKQIQGEISNLSIALKTVNVDGALQAIQALVAKIQTALDPKNVPVNKELAQTYLAPIKELLNGLEVAQGAIARIIPKLGEGQKGKAEELLKNVQTQIIATNTALNDFGKTANTTQLTTRFEEAKLKARELNAEISRLGKGSFDQTKYNDFELRLQGINNQYKAISKENESFGAGLRISELNNLIDTASRSLKDFGKTTNFDTLNNQLIALRDKFPTLNADIADFDKLFREAFAGTKTAINIKPLIDLKNEVQDVKNNLKNPAQDTLYTTLLRQLDALINKTTIYNATVKAGASKADVGVQAFIDPAAVNASKASLQALEAELNNNKIALDTFLKSGNQTKETATQIAEGFKVTDNSVKSLTAEIGLLSGVSSNLLHHINALKAVGADASAFEAFRASIEAIIKTKKDLDTQFKGGSLTGKLKEDLDRLVDVKDALSQFKTVGDSFKSAAFFESTSYSARQTLEEIQRLTSAMRTVSSDIGKSLSVSRTGPINPEIEKELRAQQKLADEAIIKLREMGAVYSQLNSKPKNESFQQLKETIEQAFGGGVTGLRAFRTEFDTLIRGVSTSSASLISGVAPLTETLINSFKQQSESIIATRTQYEAWLNLLRSEKAAGQKTFTLPDGSTRSIDRLITVFQNLLDKANAVKAPIEAAATALKGKLDTAAGQAEVRIDKLVNKFTQLQDRINTLNPGSSINEMYGSIKELMMLLDRPYKTGPFFTLPKESFAPIRNELQSVLEVAKNVQAGLEFNLTSLTKGSLAYKDTQTAIKAAREEVERLTAASQKLSEFEKNASHFSSLRGNLHGASTTLQELAHEGAFIYKGLEALFKNLAKNLTGPVVTINTTTLNSQLDQLTTKFGVTGTAADHLKTQVKEALNTQLGGGGLAAAEQYQKAFQQLEEAFVKFRSGLTQAAMGFQMLGDSLLEPFKKAKEGFEQFSDTMGVVNAVSNATQAQFKALTDQALLMGATTRFTAEQAAEGLKQLAKAGYTAEEQIASLPTVMRLAQAAATDLATAATIATVVMKEFRMDPDQFNEAADKITLAANRTLGTVEDLGYSFKYVGALAANIGADFGDLTAAIGLLHNAGLKGCYDDQTEILTRSGFKLFKNLDPDDEVMTINEKTLEMEWQLPVGHYAFTIDEPMARIKSRYIDLLVTDNHRLLIETRAGHTKVVEACDFKEGYFYRTGIWKGTKVDNFVLKGFIQNRGSWDKTIEDLEIPIELWAQFLGWYLAEGSLCYTKGSYTVTIAQSKGNRIDEIRELLTKLPFNFNYDGNCFRITSQQLYQELETYGKGFANKRIPEYIKELDSETLKIFLEHFRRGDGDVQYNLYTSNKGLSEDLYEVALKCGYGVQSKIVGLAGDQKKFGERTITASQDAYLISISTKHTKPFFSVSEYERREQVSNAYTTGFDWVPYKGQVFSVSVPNGLVFVRRNGFGLFCGNTLAGTALRGMLMALYNPTRDETKLIAELGERIGGLGLQIQDASGNFVGYGKIVKQLEQAGITTGEVLRFFGQRAGPGMAALLAQGSEALKNLEDDLKNAEGTTAHMAEIMEQTLKGRLLLMRSAFEALLDSIGHNLAPTLAAAANAMAEFVSRFVAVRQEFPALATAVDHVLAGFALFASVLGGLAVTFAFIIVPVRQFMGFLKTLIVTTLAGAASITSLSAAQAFNAKVTAATMVAVETEFRARIAQVTATAGATTAVNYDTIAREINVVAIREQTAALLGATAATGANATAQLSMWTGLKNVILGLGRNLLNIGGLLRFAFLSPLGLVLTAITGVVAYTLLHEKSVAQTNVELDKQSQIIEYSRKNIIKLNEELLSSAEQLKRNQQALNELRSGDGPERNLLAPQDQTTEANLQLDIDKGKKEIQKQLKELFTQITESSTYRDLVNFKIEFDASGAFKQFTTVLKDGNKEFEILGDNLEFNTDQLKRFTKALDETALARQRSNAEEKIANELSKLAQQKLSKENFGQLGSQFKNPFAFDTDFEENNRNITRLTRSLKHYSDQIEKLKNGASLKDVGFSFTTLDLFKTPTNEEAIKRLEDLRIRLNDELAKLNVTTNSQIGEFVDYFVKTVPDMLGKGLDEIAVQNADNPEIIKNILNGIFNLKNFDRAAFDPVYAAIQAELNQRNKSLTTEQLVGENLKKPVIGLVNATKDLVTYLEATNKELKTKIDEQKKIFDEAKVVVDAVKAYQMAIATAAKDTLDVRNQEIEFEAKIKTENLDRSFEEQLRELEDANRVIELPFKAKLITGTTDISGFKALSNLSGLLLDYEKKNTAEFVKIQSANSQRIKEIKLVELNDKQAATTQYYQTLKNHYSVDSADYLKAQQEQANATKENLDARLEAVQNHLKDLLKLYQDNAKAIIDLEKQKKQFQAAIEQTRVNFGNAQLLPTEQLQKAKFDLNTLDAQIQGLLKEEKFDDAIARLNEYQKLVDQIATSAGAQPELTLKVANLAENLEFDLDRIDFEKEFNKANIRITTGAKGLGDAFSSTFTKFKPLSSSFVPQLESGAVDVKKALQTVVKVYGEEVDKLKKKDEEGFRGLGEGISTLQYASANILKSFSKSFDDNLQFKKAQKEVEAFGNTMENAFNVRPVTDLVKGVNDLDARLSQITQAQNALNEFGIPGESTSAVPLLSNISETGEKGIVTLRNVKGEMIALSLQAKTEIKPLEGLTTDIQKGKEALIGFKSLIDTQIDDLSRGDKVVELPISFKADFNAFDTAGLAKYSAEVLSYEKNLNKEVLDLQLKRINATLEAEQKAVKDKQTIVTNQITAIESLYDKQLGDMQNWSKQDLDAYKTNIESKKSSLVSFLQEELSATQSTYNELFQIRANLLNKNKALEEQYISFQANATKNFQTIDDLGKSDSQKTYETRLKSLNLQADADAALAQGDYDRAKALLEQRQQLIDAAVSSLKPEDTIGKFFLKQDQTEAVTAYKKVTDALKTQNQSAVKEVEAQLNSVNGQILALKQSADTAKTALQDLLNKLFELSTKKFQAEVEVIQKNTQQAENLGEQAYNGAIAQRQDIGKTLLQDREKVKKEEYALLNLYKEQIIELRKTINLAKEKQLVKIGIDPESYEEVLAYAKFYLDSMDAISKDQVENQLARTKLADLENQYKELQKLKQAKEELLVVEKQLAEITVSQKQLSGLVGFSNTINTATASAEDLQAVFNTMEDKETGLNTEELTVANKLLEELRKSSQGVREDFNKIEVDEKIQSRLTDIFKLFETDVSKLKGEELKSFVNQMTTALSDLEGFQRDINSQIAGEAKNTALNTIAEVQASLLKIDGILKDTKISPEVKDISLKDIRKQLEDQLKNLQVTIDTADKSGNQEQIAALTPLKDLLLQVREITKSTLSDEEKITQLLNIKNTLAQKQKELSFEQKDSIRRATEFAEKQKRIEEQKLTTAKAQSKAAQDTAQSQESIAQAANDTADTWAKATPNEQSQVLTNIQGIIDEISQAGLQLIKPEDQKQISSLFDQLKNAQTKLSQAFESGDTAAITQAITEIKELGVQFKNTAGLSEVARQKFGELANIPSFDVAIKVNTSSIPPAKQAVADLKTTVQQDTAIQITTDEVTLAVNKLADVQTEIEKLKGLSAVEFKGYTNVDVEKSKQELEAFAQRAKALLEVPISARDEEFKAKLRALFVDYDQFRSQLQPIKIEGDVRGFNETYQKALGIVRNLRDQAQFDGSINEAQKYNNILNALVQAKLNIQSKDINIKTQGYEKLKTLINVTKELTFVLTEAEKKELNIKMTTVGKDVVISDITSIGTALDNIKNKVRSLNDTLNEVRGKLSKTATVPGLEKPTDAFDALNQKLIDTRNRLKEAFESKNLNEASLDAFKNSIHGLIDQMSKVEGVTPEMVKALREAADVELKDYTLEVKPEIQPVEIQPLEPYKIQAIAEVNTNTESLVSFKEELNTLTNTPFSTTITALVDQAVSGIGQVLGMLNNLPSSRTIVINTVYRTSGSPPTQAANKGGLIGNLQHFADGGLAKFKEMASAFVPGIGNTDTVPAMLTPGEFVVKKERVKSLGIGFLNALNSGLLQFKSAGGMIYNSPINTLNSMSEFIKPNFQIPQQVQSAGGPPIDINLTIKDKTFNIKTPRDEAKKLVSALQYLERGITKK